MRHAFVSSPLGLRSTNSTFVRCAERRPRHATSGIRARAPLRACTASDAVIPPTPTPPPESVETPRLEPVAVRAARAVWRVGWLAWWGQLVLTVISIIILAFTYVFPGASVGSSASAPGIALSFVCAAFAALSWAWTYVYTRASLRLAGASSDPAPLKRLGGALRGGVVLGIIGCAVGLVALQATVGALLARTFTAGAGATATTGTAASGLVLAVSAVQPVDLLVAQAAVNALCSLFLGLLAALWLKARVRAWENEQELWKAD